MKNVFFTLVLMLVGTFAFANNAIGIPTDSYDEAIELAESLRSNDFSNTLKIENNLEVFGTCYITVGAYDGDGNLLLQFTIVVEDVDSAEECNEIADSLG
jgi:hypothetical protein